MLRVRRLSQDEITSAIGTLLSDTGRIATFADGVCVVSDVANVLDRVAGVIRDLEALENPAWVVQLFVISYGETAAREFGVDVIPAARIAAGLASGSGSYADAEVSIELLLRAAAENSDADLVAEPMFLLSDGETATYQRLESIPFRTITRNNSNAVQEVIEQVDFLEVGFDSEIGLRETGPESAAVEVRIDNSSVIEFNGELPPTTARESYVSEVPIGAGAVYLVGAYESNERRRSQSLGFRRQHLDEARRRVYQVWLRAYRISGSGVSARSTAHASTADDGDPAVVVPWR
ncbi:MAG: hypothetical protein AAF456_12165 [Planctomycetota bacterium]